ncbi:MAG: ribulose bisphosphate carboxylase small subunit [candidate division KSB1 bacterium]|nr:ribulose bisphosphate carboxylase small subunit [candidate division KSB1 bacterium]MDZ7367570.1 ribulose bisphosphate carboxylase small subunit [candidate division KSB1 bacterium]MDZ7405362.1 ribulose bisphosphate carboxylase small subunit [candidate division KSB1 bacterium]
MRITQGTFSYLPDFNDDEIKAQVQYCLDNGWPISIEYTDDPHPRNVYWQMWGLPMFDIKDAAAIMYELHECRKTFPNHYIKISGYDRSLGRATTVLSFIVNRPKEEPGFHVERLEDSDRRVRYTIRAYAADRPAGQRYEAQK